MDVSTFVIVCFYVGQCYGQNRNHERRLNKLQVQVDNLSYLALDLRVDIGDLQSWRNSTIVTPGKTGAVDSDNECVDSQLLGFEKSLDTMAGRVRYLVKGLEGEKVAIRETIGDIRAECTEEKIEMEKAFDAKLNQHMLTTESKVAEIIERLNRMSEQPDASRKNGDDSLDQLEVSNQYDAMSTTVKADTGIARHRDEQYYNSMKQDGWLQYNDFLYKHFRERVTFDTAVERCKDQDASLIEITDEEEKQFFRNNFKYYQGSWVGATDRETEGEWRWLSGQLVREGNWYQGQPDHRWSGENCMAIDWSTSYNFPCTIRFYYVCKRQ